jgi:hypothetical protein
LAALIGLLTAAGCGTSQPAATVQPRTLPLPTSGIASRKVTVYPLRLLVADDALDWGDALADRPAALSRADSLIAALLTERAPEVVWVWPDELRRAARRAPGLLADPDRVATSMLGAATVTVVPDPLRSQMRALTGVVGERYALVPAGLIYTPSSEGVGGEAALTVVMTDVRMGTVGWRSTARGTGTDPWSALRAALKTLFPELP